MTSDAYVSMGTAAARNVLAARGRNPSTDTMIRLARGIADEAFPTRKRGQSGKASHECIEMKRNTP